MKNDFLISTTNNIEGGAIKKYVSVVCTNIVVGTNIFSDFAASFTDFFGGRSESYKKKLDIIYNESIKELRHKAVDLGANAIIGFKVDFDEISGKDKSMFMVSASGTACIIDYEQSISIESHKKDVINQYDLENEIFRRRIIAQINEGSPIKRNWSEYLMENPQIEIVDNCLERYIKDYANDSEKECNLFIEKYISVFPREIIIKKVYGKYLEHSEAIKSLITNCMLFCPSEVLLFSKSHPHYAIDLLLSGTDYYCKSDIDIMKQIYDILISLPNTGKIENVKGGVFSRDNGEKFICEKGHKNSVDLEYCYSCGVNIKGLTNKEVAIINKFKEKIDVLQDMLS